MTAIRFRRRLAIQGDRLRCPYTGLLPGSEAITPLQKIAAAAARLSLLYQISHKPDEVNDRRIQSCQSVLAGRWSF